MSTARRGTSTTTATATTGHVGITVTGSRKGRGEKDLTPRARLKLAPPTITQPGGVAPRSLTLFIFNINMYKMKCQKVSLFRGFLLRGIYCKFCCLKTGLLVRFYRERVCPFRSPASNMPTTTSASSHTLLDRDACEKILSLCDPEISYNKLRKFLSQRGAQRLSLLRITPPRSCG